MSHRKALSQWEQTVSRHLPHLSRPQAHVLALWSYGMVLAKSCGITSVAALLADLLGSSLSTLRQQLREWCYDAEDKKGEHRQEVDVTLCFAPLLCWIVSWWPQTERRLALAMDATTLSDRFTVLCISVLYRRCAIPVAWKMLRGGEKGAWEPYWKELLTTLKAGVPKDWTVIVLADRGLYAPWLFRHIVALGWHPFLRINLGGKVRPLGAEKFDWLSSLVPHTGSAWCGVVDCFVQSTLRCTLLARWDARLCRPVAGADRFGPRSRQRRVVQHAHLDRRQLQGYQARRLAVASNQDDRSQASESAVVGDCGGDVVGRQRGRRGRCHAVVQRVGGLTRTAYRTPQGHHAFATAVAELLCSRVATHFCGRAARTTTANGTLLS